MTIPQTLNSPIAIAAPSILARPVPPTDDEQQRRGYLLQVLLLIVGLGCLLLIFVSNISSFLEPDMATLIPELVGLLVTGVCYLLNRQGYTSLAAVIFFLTVNLIIAAFLFTRPDANLVLNLRSVPTLLTIPVVAAGVIIRPRYSFIFAGIGIISIVTIGLLRMKPAIMRFSNPAEVIAQLDVPIALLFIMAGLSWFFERKVRSLIDQLTTQNRNLNVANRELAYKREMEQQVSREVNTFTNQLSHEFTTQNLSTAQQLSVVNEVSQLIEQLHQAGLAIAESAQRVDHTAQRTLQVAEVGTGNVRAGLVAISLLSEQAQSLADSMTHLYQQAHQIDQIAELTSEITEEINLLALNAKIEAAGAGEYGRRFGAVADQVQKLASRSRAATRQVRQVVEQVQQAIEDATTLALAGTTKAVAVMQETRSVEETLEGMVTMVNNTATLAHQISYSIQEQRDATVEAVAAMHEISTISLSVWQNGQNVMNNLQGLNSAVTHLNAVVVNNPDCHRGSQPKIAL